MLSLYEILKASKTGLAPDMWTALAGMNWGGADSGHEVKELTGIPPLNFTANGSPLISWRISGNTVQSGTPSLDSPIMPQETGERTGNLFDKDKYNIVYGYFIAGGTTTITAESNNNIVYIPCKPNTSYTVSKISSNRFGVGYTIDKPAAGVTVYGTVISYAATSLTVTTDSSAKYIVAYIRNGNATGASTLSEIVKSLQITESSTALPYEPYGYKIPISSVGQTNNIYLGEVETTRRVKKLVLTGEEEWRIWAMPSGSSTQRFYINISGVKIYLSLCSHFVGMDGSEDVPHFRFGGGSYNELVFFIDNTIGTITDFKSYLASQYAAGTPVTVWYVLATPETAVVNEPLRKIGDYADTVSYEQAGVQIPTNRGNTVIDVDTTLKPSEVYIKYKG